LTAEETKRGLLMKKLLKLLGIIALAVVIGFSMTGCKHAEEEEEEQQEQLTGDPNLWGIKITKDSIAGGFYIDIIGNAKDGYTQTVNFDMTKATREKVLSWIKITDYAGTEIPSSSFTTFEVDEINRNDTYGTKPHVKITSITLGSSGNADNAKAYIKDSAVSEIKAALTNLPSGKSLEIYSTTKNGEPFKIEEATGGTFTAVTNSPFGTSDEIYSIIYANNKFMAGSYQKGATSTNGTTWSSFTYPTYISAIAYGDNTYIAVGSNNIYTSTDGGTTWTQKTSNFPGGASITTIAYGNNTFVAGGVSGLVYSTDNGNTWTYKAQSDYTFNKIIYADGKFAAAGSKKPMDGFFMTSTNGTDWSNEKIFNSTAMNGIAYNGSTFVVVGNSGTLQYSTNGTTWTAASKNPFPSGVRINAVAFGGDKFAAVNNSGKIAISPDGGVNWVDTVMPADASQVGINAITYGEVSGKKIFVAGGKNGKMWYLEQ
jgi:photosystem II stability/assembly factor-like uncharacterized protein